MQQATSSAAGPPIGSLATQRKRITALTALAASAGTIFVVVAGGMLMFPAFDAFVLPKIVKEALKANAASNGTGAAAFRSPHDVINMRQDAVDALLRCIDAYEDQGSHSVLVLHGKDGIGKSSIARRLLTTGQRPGLYASFRACESVQDALYSYLYFLLEPVGFVGSMVIAYVKVVNAVMELWAMNQVRQHVSLSLCCVHG